MAKTTRLLKRADEKILHCIREHSMLRKGEKVLVALSGGPDSVFLLHFFLRYKKMYSLKIGAAHVNHSLRGTDADADEAFCRGLCRSLRVPFYAKKTRVAAIAKRKGISVEEAGRITRYGFFRQLMHSDGYTRTATGHTLNDNAESVLLNIFKGSGLNGLTGIAPVFEGDIIRPMLTLSKEELTEALREQNISFRTDESNSDEAYQRNFLRAGIIPPLKKELNPSLDDALGRLSSNVRGACDFISSYLQARFGGLLRGGAVDSVQIPLAACRGEHRFLISELFRALLSSRFGLSPTKLMIDSLLGLIDADTGKTAQLTSSLTAVKDRDGLVVRRNEIEAAGEWEIEPGKGTKAGEVLFSIYPVSRKGGEIPREKGFEFIDAGKVRGKMTLRRWRRGDLFKPLGMKSPKTVSDFLTDAKVPAASKKRQLVLCDEKAIIWVSGLRISDDYKVTAKTKNIYQIGMK